MKRWIKFLAAVLLMSAGSAVAQYQMTLQNPVVVSPTVFQFDVYIVSTGASFTLSSYGIQLACDATIANGGTLGFGYVASSSTIAVTPLGEMTSVTGGVTSLIVASNVGSQIVSTTPLKVGTFQVTNTAAFGTSPAAMTWSFTGFTPTMVNINSVNSTVPVNHINALAPYKIMAANDVQVNASTYEFDVIIQRTVADFTMTSYQIAFTYNTAVANGGTLSFTYIPATTTLTSCAPLTAQIINDGGVPNMICGSNAGSQLVSTSTLVIGRFRLTNTVNFAVQPMNIAWDFSGAVVTQVNLNNSNITVAGNFATQLGNAALPVELTSFTGKNRNDAVELKWSTATEAGNYGFDIERKSVKTGWEKIGFVAGQGDANTVKDYAYLDKEPVTGKIEYRLKQIDVNGAMKYSDVIDVVVAPPAAYSLLQNSPNPFNPTTSIKYQLPAAAFVSLTVYDMLGREIAALVNEDKPAGSFTAEWNGRDSRGASVASGVYLYRLSAGPYVVTKKMNLLK